MHARYYNNFLGRFLSPDEVSVSNYNLPMSWNRYAYSAGNPLKYKDVNGLWITLSGESGDKASLRNIMVNAAKKEQGRALLRNMANSSAQYNFSNKNLNPQLRYTPAEKAAAERNRISIVGGSTSPSLNECKVNVAFDVKAVSTYHQDTSGVTTFFHEWEHEQGVLNGKDVGYQNGLDRSFGGRPPEAEAFGTSISQGADWIPSALDNMSADDLVDQFIREGEMEQLQQKMEEQMQEFISNLENYILIF